MQPLLVGMPRGGAIADPAAYVLPDGIAAVFVRGADDRIWGSFSNGKHGAPWIDLGDPGLEQ